MKIRKKASLLFVSLFVIAFLSVGIITVLIVKSDVTQLVSNNLKSISSIQLKRIESINSQNLERLNLISSRTQLRISLNDYNENPQEMIQQKMNAILEDAKLSVADFDQISIINLTGEIVASTNKIILGENADINDSIFLRSQKQNITNIYNLDEKGNLKIYMYGPLVDNNKTLGIVCIIATSEKIQNFLSDYSGLGTSGYTSVVLLDKYNDKNLIISPERSDTTFRYKQGYYNELDQIAKHILDKKIGIFQNLLDNKQELMFASIEYSENLNLGLSVRISKAEVLQPLGKLILLLTTLMMAMIIILVFVINYSTKLISKPIESLTERMGSIGKGNLDQKVEIESKDEIGLLAKSFSTMLANLRESEGRWQYALESSGEGVWDWNAQTNEVFFSKRWKEMLGYKDDEISNNLNEWEKLIHPEEKEKNQTVLNKFLKGETAFLNMEHRLLCKDGSYKSILSRGKIIEHTADNKPLRIIGTHIDLTQQKQSELKLNLANNIINRSPVVAFRWKNDKGWPIEFVSDNVEQLTEYSVEEFMSKKKAYSDLIYEHDQNKVVEEVEHFSAEKDTMSFSHEPYRIISKSGEIKWVDDLTIIRRDTNGVITHYEGVVLDITDKKRGEEDLIREKEFSERIIETSTAIIIGLDKNHLIQLFNKGAEEITGYSKEEVIGKDWFKIFFPDEMFDEMNRVWKGAWGMISHSYENPILIKSGEERMISWQTTGVYEGEESPKHLLISIGEDITNRKKADYALRESQIFNKTLLDTSPDLIYVYDIVEGKNIYSNQGIMKILGYTIEEVQTMGENLLPNLMQPDDFNTYLKDIIPRYQIAKDGEIVEHEYRMKHKNGHWCWLNSKESIFMRQDDGSSKQIFGLTSDITIRKTSEIELKKYQNNLEDLVRERTQELEDKNSLLERTNKAFVGRELRMAELKKEIEKMKKGE